MPCHKVRRVDRRIASVKSLDACVFLGLFYRVSRETSTGAHGNSQYTMVSHGISWCTPWEPAVFRGFYIYIPVGSHGYREHPRNLIASGGPTDEQTPVAAEIPAFPRDVTREPGGANIRGTSGIWSMVYHGSYAGRVGIP